MIKQPYFYRLSSNLWNARAVFPKSGVTGKHANVESRAHVAMKMI